MNATKYTMVVRMCEGVENSRFVFESAGDTEAKDAAFRWARYHGMSVKDVWARKSVEQENLWEVHNDYLR